ncbi:MAG: hypothetical protein LBR67_04950 [Dysgonamonadaceae bacterium]|jgi:GNAT superfamily N-acetyltransferase|nr:hypothetical protein [Dysgonamonadaceae bacterium]
MSITIKEVQSKRELKDFIKFNIKLYKDCPYHVPGLISEEMMTLSKEKNPAFDFCEAKYFLAIKDNKIVGRIAGIINHKANEQWKEKNLRFGFIDFIDDEHVSKALLDAVIQWGKEKGMEAIHGPLGFTDLDHEGLLVWGFEEVATMATTYSYPYYKDHLEKLGFVKDQDWKEFKIWIPEAVPEKHLRIGEIVLKKYGLRILKFKKTKEIWPYARKIFETLNVAYAHLYGFVALSPKQIDYYVKMYIPMLRLDLITLIVRDSDDAVAGFAITLPNLSKAMQKARGSLFPFGIIHLLKSLYSKPKVVDLYLMGVLPEYRGKGVNALIFNDLIPRYIALGTVFAESNPELESNNAIQAQWDYFRTEHHKTRRAFIKQI